MKIIIRLKLFYPNDKKNDMFFILNQVIYLFDQD